MEGCACASTLGGVYTVQGMLQDVLVSEAGVAIDYSYACITTLILAHFSYTRILNYLSILLLVVIILNYHHGLEQVPTWNYALLSLIAVPVVATIVVPLCVIVACARKRGKAGKEVLVQYAVTAFSFLFFHIIMHVTSFMTVVSAFIHCVLGILLSVLVFNAFIGGVILPRNCYLILMLAKSATRSINALLPVGIQL